MFVITQMFDSQLLSDGHLFCPKQFRGKKNAQFKVLVIFEDIPPEASDYEMETAAIQDTSEEYLSQEELGYYLKLQDV